MPRSGRSAAALARRLLDSYPGHFLAGDEDQPWLMGLRDRLRSKLLRAVLALGHALAGRRALGGRDRALPPRARARQPRRGSLPQPDGLLPRARATVGGAAGVPPLPGAPVGRARARAVAGDRIGAAVARRRGTADGQEALPSRASVIGQSAAEHCFTAPSGAHPHRLIPTAYPGNPHECWVSGRYLAVTLRAASISRSVSQPPALRSHTAPRQPTHGGSRCKRVIRRTRSPRRSQRSSACWPSACSSRGRT